MGDPVLDLARPRRRSSAVEVGIESKMVRRHAEPAASLRRGRLGERVTRTEPHHAGEEAPDEKAEREASAHDLQDTYVPLAASRLDSRPIEGTGPGRP